jgi:3,4-dihydroxy 2-butanone 4-phosphate synthase/GTP cyclohydrolase II
MRMNFAPIPEILEDIRLGRMVVIVDDEDRENEGDLIMAAELVKPRTSTSWSPTAVAWCACR